MAKLRVFISSTYYDLRHVREVVARFINELGYEDILFEQGKVSYGTKEAPAEYCYKEIDLCDILISFVGGRFGAESSEQGYSITQKELKHAYLQGKQVYIFVDRNVLSEYETYKVNRETQNMKYKYVDDKRVYEFLDEIYLLPRNNPVFSFSSPQEIIKVLKEQWAGLFQRLLNQESGKQQIDAINTLSNSISTLEQMINAMALREKDTDSIKSILLLNHPAFFRVQEILQINYRILFTSISELSKLLKACGYSYVTEDQWDEPDVIEWVKTENCTMYLFKVRKQIFDEDSKLRADIDGWNSENIFLDLREPEEEFADEGEDIEPDYDEDDYIPDDDVVDPEYYQDEEPA